MKSNIKTANNSSKWILCSAIILAALFVKIFYPGLMSPDSASIYSNAKAGIYGDHHPPMMAYLWNFFLKFSDGPALMLLTSMSMLWGSCVIMALFVFKNKPWRFACLLIPFVPQVAVYAGWIWKDNFFTFGYLFLSMWLAYKDIEREKFNWIENIIFFILLSFATSVKYQAKFILPILLFWYVSIQFIDFDFSLGKNKVKSIIKTIFVTIILCLCVVTGIKNLNSFLVTEHGNGSNNSWKYKMIYDLAGASIHSNKILVPKFLAKKETFTIKDLKDHHELEGWEGLIVHEHSPLRTPSDKELVALDKAWKQMIFNHPIGYLKHRLYIWSKGVLLGSPGKGYLKGKSSDLLAKNKQSGSIFRIFSFLMSKFSWLIYAFTYVFIFPFQMYFLFSSFKTYQKTNNKYAKVIFLMSIMGLNLLFFLLFFSLAALPRYIYFTNIMFFFSIPFFVAMCREKNRNEETITAAKIDRLQ